MQAKVFYYTKAVLQFLYPTFLCRMQLKPILSEAEKRPDFTYILERVDYYNQKNTTFCLAEDAVTIKSFFWKSQKWFSTYFCDTYEYIRYFPLKNKFSYLFGDIKKIPDIPTIVKTRPLSIENTHSIILKLNKYRHFHFIKDKIPFSKKENKLIFYTALINKPNRLEFIQKYFHHPLCLCRCIKKSKITPVEWVAPRISIKDHLKYKFILALEGNDVATCLKWVMSSSSIAVMPRPTCESWFMEGQLIPDYHYILIKNDFSDVEEKLNYFINNPKEAEKIIKNANDFVDQFKDKKREKIISLLVLKKYFDCQ